MELTWRPMSTHAHICTVNTDSGLDWDLKCVDMVSDWGDSMTSLTRTHLQIISNTSKSSLRIFFSASQYPIRKLADELINFGDDMLKHASCYNSQQRVCLIIHNHTRLSQTFSVKVNNSVAMAAWTVTLNSLSKLD